MSERRTGRRERERTKEGGDSEIGIVFGSGGDFKGTRGSKGSQSYDEGRTSKRSSVDCTVPEQRH